MFNLAIYSSLIAYAFAQACLEPSPNSPFVCCTAGTDDNPPDECMNGDSTDLEFDVNGICNENFDCCTCTSIRVTNARSHTCGGDQSCIGVPMFIEGDDLGAVLNCNGDVSCRYCNITGENMIGLKCDGDDACRNTYMEINLNSGFNTDQGIAFPCNGDGTCQSSTIKAKNVVNMFCNGDFSCNDCDFDLDCKTNGNDVGCPFVGGGDDSLSFTNARVNSCSEFRCGGDNSCASGDFNITCVPNGCLFNCGGDNACEFSDIDVENARTCECVGDDACRDSDFDISCVLPLGCEVRCSGESPCRDSDFDVTNSNGLLCTGLSNACRDSDMALINNIGGKIGCFGAMGCQGIELNGGDDNIPVINIIEFTCSGSKVCENADIYVECSNTIGCLATCAGSDACAIIDNDNSIDIDNVKTFSCSGNFPGSPACSGNINIQPFDNSFTMLCSAADACNGLNATYDTENVDSIALVSCAGGGCLNAQFNLDIQREGFFSINSWLCGGMAACTGMLVNYQSIQEITLSVGLMSCSGANACANAVWNVKAEIFELDLLCSGNLGCNNFFINADVRQLALNIQCQIVNLVDTCEGAYVYDIRNNVMISFRDFS